MCDSDFFRRFLYALGEINGSLNPSATKEAVVRNAALLFGARGAAMLLFNAGENTLEGLATFGLSEAYRNKGALSAQSSLGEALKQTPVVIKDVAQDPSVQYREAAIREGIKGIVGVPLSAGPILRGALRLYYAEPHDPSSDELELVKGLAQQGGLALKKALYFAALNAALMEIHQPPSQESLKAALQALVKTAAQYSLARGCALLVIDQSTNTMQSVISHGLSQRYLDKGPIAVGLSLGESATGRPVIISDVGKDERVQYKEEAAAENIKSIIGLPVRAGGAMAGVLRLYFSAVFTPDQDDLMWMESLARHAGLAIEKSRYLIALKDRHDWYKDMLMERAD